MFARLATYMQELGVGERMPLHRRAVRRSAPCTVDPQRSYAATESQHMREK
jgi:hypothetical protein